MPLSLSSIDIGRIQDTQEVLLSPLEHDSARAWCTAVVDAVGTLFRSDVALFNLAHEGKVTSAWGDGLAPFAEVLTEIVTGVQPGAIRYRDDHLDTALDLRRQNRLEVWSNRMLERLHDTPMEEMPFYREFMEPAGTVEGGCMTIGLPSGEAMIGANPGPPGRNPFGEDWLDLFRAILPAFKGGTRALTMLETRRSTLGATIDTLAGAVGIWSLDGRELHRGRGLRRLLAAEPDAERIATASGSLALRIAGLRRSTGKSQADEPLDVGQAEVMTRAARYQLRGAFLPRALFDRHAAIAVCVDRLTPIPPDPSTLRHRFGLTRRQAEVAQLLALGLSKPQVAARLRISGHTVRSHGEQIFLKLNVHTRGEFMNRIFEIGAGLPGADRY